MSNSKRTGANISGVNMRLAASGVRELHWHQAAECGFMPYGNCRVTVLDPQGRAYVADVAEGDLWYFSVGYLHSLQGLGPDGCEFILAFDLESRTQPGLAIASRTPSRAQAGAFAIFNPPMPR